MEFTGKVYRLFAVQSGTSQNSGNEWRKQEFIFEYREDPAQRWSDKVLLTLQNSKIDELSLKEGDDVKVGFEHHVREYNGRWYNDIRIYNIVKVVEQAPTQTCVNEPKEQSLPLTTAPVESSAGNGKDDDLPF